MNKSELLRKRLIKLAISIVHLKEIDSLISECHEILKIFISSIKTAKTNHQ